MQPASPSCQKHVINLHGRSVKFLRIYVSSVIAYNSHHIMAACRAIHINVCLYLRICAWTAQSLSSSNQAKQANCISWNQRTINKHIPTHPNPPPTQPFNHLLAPPIPLFHLRMHPSTALSKWQQILLLLRLLINTLSTVQPFKLAFMQLLQQIASHSLCKTLISVLRHHIQRC